MKTHNFHWQVVRKKGGGVAFMARDYRDVFVNLIKQDGNNMKAEQKKRGRIIHPVTLRVRRYRQQHTRIDYFPAPDVMDIIKHYLETGEEPCIAGIIDGLIRTGFMAVTGNGGKK